MSFLSGSLRVWIALRTVSQWPLLMSAVKASWESTVFNEMEVSSCKEWE